MCHFLSLFRSGILVTCQGNGAHMLMSKNCKQRLSYRKLITFYTQEVLDIADPSRLQDTFGSVIKWPANKYLLFPLKIGDV